MSIVISDTTPLHYLILIGNVDVLPRLFNKVLAPPAVIEELKHPNAPHPVAAWASHLPEWVEVRTPCTDLQLHIGTGEDQAISLAVELGNVPILMDDRRARAAAHGLGLFTLRTITILELADDAGLLDFESELSRLQATNFYIEESILETVRAKARDRKRP